MELKHIQKIYERLRIIQIVYSHICIDAVLDTKRFLEVLEKNVLLSDIPQPTDILAESNGSVCIEWSKITPDAKMDLFNVYMIGDGTMVYEAFLDSLGTTLKKNADIKDDLDEILLIHIKHFN